MSRARRFAQSWCRVSVEALRHNADELRRALAPGAKLGVVVKSEAYGHGLELVTAALADRVDAFVVHGSEEALRVLRIAPKARVLLVGPPEVAALETLLRGGVELTVYDAAHVDAVAKAASRAGTRARLHVKVETGTGRQGLGPGGAAALAEIIAARPDRLLLAGLSTHFADIEDTLDHGFARAQHRLFEETAREVAAITGSEPALHCANSAATLLWPHTHGQLVRAGVAAYGMWPSRETWLASRLGAGGASRAGTPPELRPALTWLARIVQIRPTPAGRYVGYGRTYRTTAPSTLAVLAVGYADGYDRRLSNRAHLLVGGTRVPVRGRVCMNLLMADVTHVPEAAAGGTAVLLGRQGDEEVSAELLASWIGTINYEVTARIASDLPRIAVDVPLELRAGLREAGVPVAEN